MRREEEGVGHQMRGCQLHHPPTDGRRVGGLRALLALLIALFLSVVVACVPRPSLSPTPTPTLAAPTATPTPLVAPQPSPSPTPTPSELLTRVPAPPPLDPPTLAQQLRLKSREPMHRRLEQPWPQDLPLGHRESFWVADVQEPAVYTVQAQLLHIS
ncbi:MAG: hypothetical protein ACE5IG_02260, partial [Dehalococcoidia bacterium]